MKGIMYLTLTILVMTLQVASLFSPEFNLAVIKSVLNFFQADFLFSVC